MQALLRTSQHLPLAERQPFIDKKGAGQLVKPEDSGYVLGRLALYAQPSLSGQFLSWDSDACTGYRRPDGK